MTDLREALNAILYLATGACWRQAHASFTRTRRLDARDHQPIRPRASRCCPAAGWSSEPVAWLGQCHCLAKDWEHPAQSSTAWANIASIRMITRRIVRIADP